MTAPVCDIQPNIPITQPDTRKIIPNIPIATDLSSALKAINSLRNLVFQLLNSQSTGRFSEVDRTSQVIRVFNPADKTQWVDVQQITSLTMRDSHTGEIWAFKL